MANYTKNSYSKFLKNIRTSYPVNRSKRNPICYDDSRLTNKEFKLVLPMLLKDSISGKGSSIRPEYDCVETMNVMINCLKLNEYNENQCSTEVGEFLKCFNGYNVSVNEAIEQNKKGIVKVEEFKSNRYPKNFVLKMLNNFKTPRKVDNGLEIPIK